MLHYPPSSPKFYLPASVRVPGAGFSCTFWLFTAMQSKTWFYLYILAIYEVMQSKTWFNLYILAIIRPCKLNRVLVFVEQHLDVGTWGLPLTQKIPFMGRSISFSPFTHNAQILYFYWRWASLHRGLIDTDFSALYSFDMTARMFVCP